jgi:hypothetical protein
VRRSATPSSENVESREKGVGGEIAPHRHIYTKATTTTTKNTRLVTRVGQLVGVKDVRPRFNGLRPPEAEVADRRPGVRDAVEDADFFVADGAQEATHAAGGGVNQQWVAVAAEEVRGRVVVGLEVRPAQRRGQQEQAQQAAPHFGIVRSRLVGLLWCFW